MQKITRQEIEIAYANSIRDFSLFDLRGANLSDADLWGAKSVVKAIGIYGAHLPRMSSRNDALYGGINDNGSLFLVAGCWRGSADELRSRVVDKKGEQGAARYLLAITMIEQAHALDVADGTWAHMLENSNHTANTDMPSP